MQCLDVGVVGEGEPAFGVERRVHHRFRCLAQRLALLGVEIRVTGGGPAGEQLGSAGQGVLHVGKYIHLDAGVMQPCPVGVFPTFDGHAPVAQLLLHLCEFGIPRVQRGMLASLQLRRVQVEACVLHGHRGRAMMRPRGFFSTAVAPTFVRPSMNTWAETVNCSPISTRAA